MFKWIRRLFTISIVVILALAIAGMFLPSTYTVTRSLTIDAGTGHIHYFVGDLKHWNAWAPWLDADPSIHVTLGKQTSGPGATQSWTGQSGSGSLTITDSAQETGIIYDLSFDQGAYHCTAAIQYKILSEGKTQVTWTMQGNMTTPIIGPYFALAMDPLLVGPMLQRGLENLKSSTQSL